MWAPLRERDQPQALAPSKMHGPRLRKSKQGLHPTQAQALVPTEERLRDVAGRGALNSPEISALSVVMVTVTMVM